MLDLAEIALQAAPGAPRGLDHDVDEGGMQHDLVVLEYLTSGTDDGERGVPCSRGSVKPVHLAPSHLRAASSALARSSGAACAKTSSSMTSPLPAVLATMCHFRPSTLSACTPPPVTSTRARRFCAIALFCLAALRSSATAAVSFLGVPVPL